jgi:putative transposase
MSKKYNSVKPNRRSIRLKGYDYALPAAYFVTLVVQKRICLFGFVEGSHIRLNEIGEMIIRCWLNIPDNFDNTSLDEFVLMPNHLHGIIFVHEAPGKGEALADTDQGVEDIMIANASPLQPRGTQSRSLSAIIQNFKSVSTRMVNKLYFKPGNKIWQRNFYERIIPNQRELDAIHQYIIDNPSNWKLDRKNPTNV